MDCIIHTGDALEVLRTLPNQYVQVCVTSPPYWGLRDYGVSGQMGLEPTPEEYVAKIVEVFREVKRVLRKDGTLWINLGDSYAVGGSGGASNKSTLKNDGRILTGARNYEQQLNTKSFTRKTPVGLKPKDLVGIPWRVAFALQADGWYLRSDIIWSKPNPMPESVKDRPTKAHEYIFLLSKGQKYYYDADAIREPHISKGRPPGNKSRIYLDRDPAHHTGEKRRPGEGNSYNPAGRNKRTVWTVAPRPYKEAHFATFPPKLIEPCILAGCPEGGTVLDPFSGASTTGLVAMQYRRRFVGIELNPEYVEMSKQRIRGF